MVAKKITQCRKPHGNEGFETIKNMNKNHEDISKFAFECININKNDKILDIGCGGGINIEKFLKLTNNNVDGLDYSEISIKASTKQNQKAIKNKRCKLIHANVTNMPIKNQTYDKVSAFETIYFWPNIENTFKEVLRIIKPKGQFIIAQGTDGNHPDDKKWLKLVEGMNLYTANDLKKHLINAGFKKVKTQQKENDHIIIVIATK